MFDLQVCMTCEKDLVDYVDFSCVVYDEDVI